MYRAIVFFIMTGCGFQTPNPLRDAAPDPDVPVDMPPDMTPASNCIGRFVEVCRATTPGDVMITMTTTINTDTDLRCVPQDQGPGAPALCVIAGNTITISAAVTVTGTRPLALAAFNNLGIAPGGSLTLSSRRGMATGAGANDPGCGAPTEGVDGTAGAGMGAGGGAGGSFGGMGGAGGNGGAAMTAGTPTAALATPTRVAGGCRGTKGGNTNATLGGAPGNGGGGVMLIARNNVIVNGTITAGGGGGSATGPFTGGGGGGSGGFIGFDAANYTITAAVTANGGGGAAVSANGDDATGSLITAAGGGASAGGDGGSGSIAAVKNGAPGGNDAEGGGGGGGSSGVILFKATAPASGALFSPPFVLVF